VKKQIYALNYTYGKYAVIQVELKESAEDNTDGRVSLCVVISRQSCLSTA